MKDAAFWIVAFALLFSAWKWGYHAGRLSMIDEWRAWGRVFGGKERD